MFLIMTGKI